MSPMRSPITLTSGTEGVGKAATSAVVFASFLILITDFVLVKVGILLFE